MMTLIQWAERYGEMVLRHGTTGAMYVMPKNQAGRWDLFHLTDYRVSSVSGPVYWLVPAR